jgi:hypothetical protein
VVCRCGVVEPTAAGHAQALWLKGHRQASRVDQDARPGIGVPRQAPVQLRRCGLKAAVDLRQTGSVARPHLPPSLCPFIPPPRSFTPWPLLSHEGRGPYNGGVIAAHIVELRATGRHVGKEGSVPLRVPVRPQPPIEEVQEGHVCKGRRPAGEPWA